jgi:hypothetical protein
LAHEAEVRTDDAAALLDELKGLVQLHAVGPHQVGQTDGGGAGDAGLAVDKHTTAFITDGVYRRERRRGQISTTMYQYNIFNLVLL